MLLDRTNHNRFAADLARRLTPAPEPVPTRAPVSAIPPAGDGREITRNDNNPPDAVEGLRGAYRTLIAAVNGLLNHRDDKGQIAQAEEAYAELSAFLKDTPAITNHDEAKLCSGYLERTRVALTGGRDERDAYTKPLNEQLAKIRGLYDLVREKTKVNAGGKLEAAYTVARARLTNYSNQVENARAAEAERLRLEAIERERIARGAEAAEANAIAGADVGECTDVGAAIAQADDAFKDFRVASKQAAIAERNVPVRFASAVGGRSQSMRTVEVLVIENLNQAIKVLGLTEKIKEAVLASARDFIREFEEPPAGIRITHERKM